MKEVMKRSYHGDNGTDIITISINTLFMKVVTMVILVLVTLQCVDIHIKNIRAQSYNIKCMYIRSKNWDKVEVCRAFSKFCTEYT